MPKIPALPFVRTGISQGWSANTAYASYQAAADDLSEQTGQNWTAGRRTVFLQMYSSLRYTREQIPEALAAPKDVPFGGLTPASRPSTMRSGYLYAAAAWTRPIGSADLEQTIHLVASNDALTPGEVESRVRQQIEDSAAQEHGTFTNYTIEGVSFTGVEALVRSPNA